MATVYRDRYDDTRSTASTRRGDDDNRTYTKVTRYIVHEDDDARSAQTTRRRESPERERETIRITRREVDDRESVASPRRSAPTYVEKDLVIRSRDDNEVRSPRGWDRRDDTTNREIAIRRTDERDDGLAISRVDERRDSGRYDYDVYRTGEYGRDRDLQRYTRTAEYYGPPNQPQTIIIRQDPIIIRERVRDDDYQLVRRSDAEEERSVATIRRDEPRDEEYFYEKRVRERYDDDFDRKSRRELSPHDSVSQVGRRRQGSFSSDDSMVYVKRVEKERYSRESSRDGKKDLAAGVIAGVGAAELLRNHRKKEGRETSQGIGRVGQDIGAGAIGAIAAEGIRRYRSKSRHGSRERSRSGSYDRHTHRDHRGRSRSRSESRSRLEKLGALGLGAVAVAAAASFATKKMAENKNPERRRSRSRRRRTSRGSVESLTELENDPTAKDSRNPGHRNSRIAAAGAIGAAGAALLDRARSKSRGREGSRERSHSRIRQGLPIAAAGLGTAALAGLYEKNKAKREAEVIQDKEKRDRRRSQSGSRGTRSDAYYDDRSRGGVDPGLVEYGYGDVAGNNYGPEYYGRGAVQEPFYGEPGAMVPAGRTRSRSRSLSRDRRGLRSGSPSSTDEGSRRRTAATGAAAGAIAASEHERRKAERRERKARKREEAHAAGRDPYDDAYPPQQPPQPAWTPPPPLQQDPYANHQGFGSQYQSQFPPPPGSVPQALPNQFQSSYQPPTAPTPQPAYAPQQAYAPTPQPNYNQQTFPPPPPGGPPQSGFNDPFHAGSANPFAPRNRGTADENVSAGNPSSQFAPPNNDQRHPDGIGNTRSLDPTPVPPPPPTPAIQVHPPPPPQPPQPPPSTSTSTPSLDIPKSYVPPPVPRSVSPPINDQNAEKRVQFAPSPVAERAPSQDFNTHVRSDTLDSDGISPDSRRQRRRQQESNRGYEAGDDTDLSPNSERRANKHPSTRDRDHSGERTNPRRERQSDRSLNTDDHDPGRRSSINRPRRSSRSNGSDQQQPSSSSKDPRTRDRDRDRDQDRRRNSSPGHDSDTTIDLPARFDEKGRKKSEAGDDALADRIDDILKGKGAAGKVFGNFMDGLFGSEGRKSGAGGVEDGEGRGGSRERRRRPSRGGE